MRWVLRFIKTDRTFKSTALMVGGQAIANIGSYLYHLSMARLLIPSDFGLLQSLISFSNILSVPLVAFNTVVAKFVSTYVGKNQHNKISSLYYQLRSNLFIVLVIGGSLFFVFTGIIMRFLHLDSFINVLFLDFALFFGLINTLNRGTLRGMSLFLQLTIVQFIESYGKLLLGIIAVSIGFGVAGAFGSFVIVIFVSLVYMTFILQKKLKPESYQPLPLKEMSKYAIPSVVMTVSIISFYNTDVVLVRHFFSAHEAGLYGALSVLGKIIFVGTSRVTTTMFPLISEAHAKGIIYHHIFFKSLIFLLVITGIAIFIYTFMSSTAIRILVGSQYLSIASYLVPFSIFMSLCAIINLIINFFLSIHHTKIVYLVFAGAITQAILITLFHKDIGTVINISLAITSLVTILLFVYFFNTTGRKLL